MVYRLVRHVSVASTEYGTVILHGGTSAYWRVNESGSEILNLVISGGLSPEEIGEYLAQKYGIGVQVAIRDTNRILDGLKSACLIEEVAQ